MGYCSAVSESPRTGASNPTGLTVDSSGRLRPGQAAACRRQGRFAGLRRRVCVVLFSSARLMSTSTRLIRTGSSARSQRCEGADVAMSSPQPPAGGPVGRLPGESLGDPAAPPAEINGTFSRSRGQRGRAGAHRRRREPVAGTGPQQVRAQAAARAAQLRGQAMEKAPQVRAQAAANRGKAAAALAFVVLVLWLRRRRSRRSSRTADGLAGALDQQARTLVGDTVDALSDRGGVHWTARGQGTEDTRSRRCQGAGSCPGHREGAAGSCAGHREGAAVCVQQASGRRRRPLRWHSRRPRRPRNSSKP